MKILRGLGAVLAVAAVIAAAWAAWSLLPSLMHEKGEKVDVRTAEVRRGDFVVKITDLGNVSARKYTPVFAPFAGKIIRLCKEGSTVKKGDFLIQFDTVALEKEVKEKELLYRQALADVEQAEEELRILGITSRLSIEAKLSQRQYDGAELEAAKNRLDRQRRLYAEQIVTLKDVESEEAAVRSKETSVRRDDIDVDIERQKMLSDVTKKRADIALKRTKAERALLDYNLARTNMDKACVRAEGKGLVVFKSMWRGDSYAKLSEGDDVYNRANLMSISDVSSLIVEMRLRETDVHRARPGQPAEIVLEAVPGRVFRGKVEKVSNVADSSLNEVSSGPGQKMFPVRIGVSGDTGGMMRPGMTASVDIIERRIPDALYVPIESVFSSGDGKYVWRRTGSSFSKCPVKVVDRNEDSVVVEGALEKGDLVALSNPEESREDATPDPGSSGAPALPGGSGDQGGGK